jgi:hypothetical protein
MASVKAILINAAVQKVQIVSADLTRGYASLVPLMGMQCEYLELLAYFDTNSLLIDEEGRFGTHGMYNGRYVGFRIDVSPKGDFSTYYESVGNGIILGVDLETGNHVDITLDLDYVESRVSFLRDAEVKKLKDI